MCSTPIASQVGKRHLKGRRSAAAPQRSKTASRMRRRKNDLRIRGIGLSDLSITVCEACWASVGELLAECT